MSVFFITQTMPVEKESWDTFSRVFSARCKDTPEVFPPAVRGKNAFGYHSDFSGLDFFGARFGKEDFFLSTEGRLPKKTLFEVHDPALVILCRASIAFLSAFCPKSFSFTLPDSLPEDFMPDVLFIKKTFGLVSRGFEGAVFSGNASGSILVSASLDAIGGSGKVSLAELII